MATLTQDAVLQLIMRSIGGSRLVPSNKLDVNGLKVTTQATSLAAIAAELKKFGDTVEEVRQAVLQNPKAEAVAQTISNIAALKDKINSL